MAAENSYRGNKGSRELGWGHSCGILARVWLHSAPVLREVGYKKNVQLCLQRAREASCAAGENEEGSEGKPHHLEVPSGKDANSFTGRSLRHSLLLESNCKGKHVFKVSHGSGYSCGPKGKAVS